MDINAVAILKRLPFCAAWKARGKENVRDEISWALESGTSFGFLKVFFSGLCFPGLQAKKEIA